MCRIRFAISCPLCANTGHALRVAFDPERTLCVIEST
jgi:hypothetical protein